MAQTANKFLKKMYLQWKKMKLEDKEQYRRAVAGEVISQDSDSVTRILTKIGPILWSRVYDVYVLCYNQLINHMNLFGRHRMSLEVNRRCQWIALRGVVWSTVKKMCLKTVLKVSKLTESRTTAGMLFQTAGAETVKECRWKSKEAWGRCKMVEAPECNALDGWWRCSSLAR